MELRSASQAFFKTFRSWSILCRSKPYHTASSYRKDRKRSFPHPSPPASSYFSYVQQRFLSTEDGTSLPDSKEDTSESRTFDKRLPGVGCYIRVDEALLDKYPELELRNFLRMLNNRVRQVLEKPQHREKAGAGTLRASMRSMPHSTVLVTALADGSVHSGAAPSAESTNLSPYYRDFRGAVVSSMTSVTLGPPAIISFNFKEPSATLSGIRAHRFFTIHFLRANADGANLASQFLNHPGDHNAAWQGVSRHHQTDVHRKINFLAKRPDAKSIPAVPVIYGPGVASHLVCKILPDKCVSNVGDHSIIVAKVVSAPTSSLPYKDGDETSQDGFPPLLLYSEGRFKEHGPAIDIANDLLTTKQHENAPIHGNVSHLNHITNQDPIFAAEPTVYQAVTSYMDSVLREHKSSEHHKTLLKLYRLTNNSEDRRAKFWGALKFWQFQRHLARRENAEQPNVWHIAENATVPEILSQDQIASEISLELVRISLKDTMSYRSLREIVRVYKKMDKINSDQRSTEREPNLNVGREILGSDAQNGSQVDDAGAENIGPEIQLEDVLEETQTALSKKEEAR